METPLPRGPERQVAQAFIAMADTLVTGFDIIDFMHALAERCVRLLGVDAAGVLMTDPAGRLQLMGASSEQSQVLELFQSHEGPCLDCFASGQAVHCADLAAGGADRAWPRFARQARLAGYGAVSALPMRLRSQTIGAMNLFRSAPGELDTGTAALAQALADIATIGLLQERTIREAQILTEQLQHALNSRVIIEQAKGMVSERHALPMDQAFNVLRRHARHHNLKLTDLAHAIVTRTTELDLERI
ncbi:GAF and ANTAR domain-containing protein [Nonomuraea turkmeniaca]|uniref:GAF and ANTAR domain-containing protein n=1 Tax=Nonomuraea turkmeniaca TaxID=103838 RepID=A0A5S4G2N9_9ACTN|nr:GAF and ANTAR domain-containing protein [Nonomuraea turkmeniaca]TMR19937.1 GAF and ANTAR domain-containing protein [Nonomuraea turkmeniaca]